MAENTAPIALSPSRRLLASILFAALFAGCEEEPPPLPEPPFLGADPSVAAPPGEARAGVVRDGEAGEAALFGGINAEGQAGDFKIYNEHVQFVIGAPRRSHGFVDTGGNIIDVDLVRTDGTLGRDTVEDVFFSFGLARLFQADTVTVEADGTEGDAARIRSVGRDVPWDLMQGLFELEEPNIPDLHLQISTEFELPPDSHSLKLTTTLTNGGEDAVTIRPRDGLMASGEDLLPWAGGRGLEGPGGDSLESVGVVGRQGEAAVALWPQSGSLSSSAVEQVAAELGIVALGHGDHELAPGATLTLTRFWSVAPDPLTIEAERWALQGLELGAVAGVVEEAGEGVAGVRLHFVQPDGDGHRIAGHVITGADGRFEVRLPAGDWTAYAVAHSLNEHVDLPAGAGRYGPFTAASVNGQQLAALDGSAPASPLSFAEGRGTPAPQTVSVAAGQETPLQFELPPASGVRLSLRDGQQRPLPGVVEVRWVGGPTESAVPSELRGALDVPGGSRAAWAWTATGELDLPLLPGSYTVNAGHSWRHDRIAGQELSVGVGEQAALELTLDEAVPRDGWLSMDPHLHGAPSFDGALPMEDRLVVCAATGVDLPVTTDHDRNTDYRPLARALGLDDRMLAVPGLEVTTIVRGHFNIFPMEPEPLGTPNGGAVAWWDTPRDTQELFDRMRTAGGPDALIQVNHPRSPGMFALADYDPDTGEPGRERFWSDDFELMELLNGGVDDLPLIRRDWFSQLSLGRNVVPTGVSDSHYRWIPCGQGRTDVFLDADDPSEVTVDAVREAVRAGHVVVAGGTTLRATLDPGSGPVLPGDTAAGAKATLAVQVRTPPWFEPGTLRVYRNGEVVHEQELPGPAVDGVWFDGGIAVEADSDAWFAVEVQGTEPMGDAWRNSTPYAMTNAFFLDVDGDGWVSPGL